MRPISCPISRALSRASVSLTKRPITSSCRTRSRPCPPTAGEDFLLTLAKSGLVSAKFAAAAAAATEALASSKADSPEAMRARLYLAASRLFSDAYDAAVADLRTLSASKLDRADASLLAAARRAAVELRLIPEPGVVDTQDPAALSGGDKVKPTGPALDDRAGAGCACADGSPRAPAERRLAMTAPAARLPRDR